MIVACTVFLAAGALWGQPEDTAIFRADFEQPATLEAWSGSGGELVEGYQGGRSLFVEQTGDGEVGSVMRRHDLPIEEMAGG